MRTDGESKFSFLLIGLGLGTKGKKRMSDRRCSVDATTEAENQAHRE
jgi:hypothetical protein